MECSSRTELSLSQSTQELVRQLREAGRPIVWVVFSGRPLVLTEVIDQQTQCCTFGMAAVFRGRGLQTLSLEMSNLRGVCVCHFRACRTNPRSS